MHPTSHPATSSTIYNVSLMITEIIAFNILILLNRFAWKCYLLERIPKDKIFSLFFSSFYFWKKNREYPSFFCDILIFIAIKLIEIETLPFLCQSMCSKVSLKNVKLLGHSFSFVSSHLVSSSCILLYTLSFSLLRVHCILKYSKNFMIFRCQFRDSQR